MFITCNRKVFNQLRVLMVFCTWFIFIFYKFHIIGVEVCPVVLINRMTLTLCNLVQISHTWIFVVVLMLWVNSFTGTVFVLPCSWDIALLSGRIFFCHCWWRLLMFLWCHRVPVLPVYWRGCHLAGPSSTGGPFSPSASIISTRSPLVTLLCTAV